MQQSSNIFNSSDISFHHLGLAVKNPQASINYLKLLGYALTEPIYDPIQKVYLIMATNEKQIDIEIIYSDEKDSPLKTILKAQDQAFYHLCYSCIDVNVFLDKLKDSNCKYIMASSPKPAILFSNKNVSFYYIKDFGLIEIIHEN